MKDDTFVYAFGHGYNDRALNGLLRKEQLYRRPWSNQLAWRLGWELANLFTRTPLRTATKARTGTGVL